MEPMVPEEAVRDLEDATAQLLSEPNSPTADVQLAANGHLR